MKTRSTLWFAIWWLALLLSSVPSVHSSSGTLSTPSTQQREVSTSTTTADSGIPRSTAKTDEDERWSVYPPWNPSRNISDNGFLKEQFARVPGEWEREVRLRTTQSLQPPCRIRQVPGDGNCLFHSISLCLQHATNGSHWDMRACLTELYAHSQELRQRAVACLNQPQRRLVLQGHECVKSRELVEAAAQQYGLTADEYCQEMLQESVWGGGPEIVALANLLRRPIHVYELVATTTTTSTTTTTKSGEHHHGGGGGGSGKKQFQLRRMACFGSPRFDHPRGRNALHILSADSRFPDVTPGRQLSDGNHFLAVFPVYDNDDDDDDDNDGTKAKRRKKLRGGSFFWGSRHLVVDMDETETSTTSSNSDKRRPRLSLGPLGFGWLRRIFAWH